MLYLILLPHNSNCSLPFASPQSQLKKNNKFPLYSLILTQPSLNTVAMSNAFLSTLNVASNDLILCSQRWQSPTLAEACRRNNWQKGIYSEDAIVMKMDFSCTEVPGLTRAHTCFTCCLLDNKRIPSAKQREKCGKELSAWNGTSTIKRTHLDTRLEWGTQIHFTHHVPFTAPFKGYIHPSTSCTTRISALPFSSRIQQSVFPCSLRRGKLKWTANKNSDSQWDKTLIGTDRVQVYNWHHLPRAYALQSLQLILQ